MDVLQSVLTLRMNLIDDLLQRTTEEKNPTQTQGKKMKNKKGLKNIKKQEKAIQVQENDMLMKLEGKKEFSIDDRIKYQSIMQQAILRLCPTINKKNINKYKLDGKNKHICMLFIYFYTHLTMNERVTEIRTIYENKLYTTLPLLYLLTKWFLLICKKNYTNIIKQTDQEMDQDQYSSQGRLDQSTNLITQAFFNAQQKPDQNVYTKSMSLHTENNSISGRRGFQMFKLCIRAVLTDIDIEEIVPILQTAAQSYRILLLRNSSTLKSIEKFRTEMNTKSPCLEAPSHFIFYFKEYQKRSLQIKIHQRDVKSQSIRKQHQKEKSRLTETSNIETTLINKQFLPEIGKSDIVRSQKLMINTQIDPDFNVTQSTFQDNLNQTQKESQNKWGRCDHLFSDEDIFNIKCYQKRSNSPHKNYLMFDNDINVNFKAKVEAERQKGLYVIKEKRSKVFKNKLEPELTGQLLELNQRPLIEKKKKKEIIFEPTPLDQSRITKKQLHIKNPDYPAKKQKKMVSNDRKVS